MKSLLVKIASVAVMFHMTFGCSMHHGLGTNACAHQHETACDHDSDSNHDEDHGDHEDHDHDQMPDSEPVGETGHSPSHAGCSKDGCNATQFVQFKFQPLDFSVPYLGGVDTLALTESPTYSGFDVDPFPDCRHSETGVRAHLLFGVQII